MKVLTAYPVIQNGKNLTPNLYYDNAEGENDEFFNGDGDGDTKKALIGTGIATGGALLVGLASKGRKTPTDVQQKCGKKPLFGKQKKQQYNDCIAKSNAPVVETAKTTPTNETAPKKPMSKGAKIGIVVGAIVVFGVIGFMVYKKMKKGK